MFINVSANSSNTAQVDNLYIKITYENYLDVVNVTNENLTLYYDPYDWFNINQTLVIHVSIHVNYLMYNLRINMQKAYMLYLNYVFIFILRILL